LPENEDAAQRVEDVVAPRQITVRQAQCRIGDLRRADRQPIRRCGRAK